MKKTVSALLFGVLICLCGCSLQLPDVNDPSYKYMYQESATADSDSAVKVPSVGQETQEVSSDMLTTDSVMQQEETTAPVEYESSSVAPSQEATTDSPPTTEAQETTRVNLDISMPEKNGSMYTDSSSDNKFIRIVNEKKGIKSSLLVAVFSVPDSGQNYVFEFYDEKGRNADDLRRVYLIDEKGVIVSISAVDSSEREGLGSIENWFSMNVLIKEVIFPAISENIK